MEIALVSYEGKLRNKATHLHSGVSVISDAPLDNHGLAQSFSPTDMVATSLATCMFTVMGIAADQRGWVLENGSAKVFKTMGDGPRRIVGIRVEMQLPKSLRDDQRKTLEQVGRRCPVAMSLAKEIAQEISFDYCL